MKLKLPLSLMAALLVCMNGAMAADSYSYEELESIPVYGTVTGSAENDYTVYVTGSSGECLDVNAKYVTWDSSYDYASTVLSVGSILTDSTVEIVTPDSAEEQTVVTTGANLFIGGWGWGISSSDGLTPLSGTVVVKDATLIVGKNSGSDTSVSQLNVGQAGSFADDGCEGTLVVDGGTVQAGTINVALSRNTKGTVTVTNGGSLTAETRGTASTNNTGSLYIGYYANTTGEVVVEKGSSITADSMSYIGMAYDSVSGGATGILTVKEGSTANLGSMLAVGYYTGSTGIITVDDSSLTAGSTYLGYYGTGTSGSLTVQNGGSASLGQLILGYYSSASGDVTVKDGGTLTAGNTWLGYSGSGELTVANGSEVALGQLVLGSNSGASGVVTVDGATLTAGNTYVGNYGSGELTVVNGGVVNLAYMDVIGSVSLDGASQLNVAGDVDVEATGSMTVSNNSLVTVAGDMTVADGGTVTVDDTSKLTVSGHYDVKGVAEMEVSAKSEVNSGSMSNEDTITITLKEESSFSVNAYKNAGETTVVADSGTSCYFGSVELSSEDSVMTLEGSGSFVLGETVDGTPAAASTVFTVSGESTESATSSYIDASAVSVAEEGSSGLTIAKDTSFTLNFSGDVLAGIGASSAETFTLTLIYGYEGFILDDESLEALLANTTYNIDMLAAQAALMTLDLDDELESSTPSTSSSSNYVVTSAMYYMDGNNLVWTGTVFNAIPEPATATLSLLALAGLAARRRRR